MDTEVDEVKEALKRVLDALKESKPKPDETPLEELVRLISAEAKSLGHDPTPPPWVEKLLRRDRAEKAKGQG